HIRCLARVPRLPEGAKVVHVVPRHRLRLQPYGFEGFVLAFVNLPARSLPVADLKDVPSDPLDRGATRPSHRPKVDLNKYVLSEIPHIHRLSYDALPGLALQFDELDHPLAPAKRGSLQQATADVGGVPLAICCPEVAHGVGVLPIERRQEATHNL